MPNDIGADTGTTNGLNNDLGGWDPERDPQRLTAIMKRSGYTADQIARLMAELGAAEAAEAERRGLPGLAKIRDTVTRQTVERWAKGQSPPRGWWSRFALIVIERLEQTLDTGFDVANGNGPAAVEAPPRWRGALRWVIPALALAVIVAGLLALVGGGSDSAQGAPAASTVATTGAEAAFAVGLDPRAVPVHDDDTMPSGAGCDIAPAVAWWVTPDSPLLHDGIWFGRVMDVSPISGGQQIIFDIACYYDQPAPGGGSGARIEPGSASVDSDNAIRLDVPDETIVYWPDQSGVFQQTAVESWLSRSEVSTNPSQLPVLCPSGWCSVWAYVNGGLVTEIVVVDFVS